MRIPAKKVPILKVPEQYGNQLRLFGNELVGIRGEVVIQTQSGEFSIRVRRRERRKDKFVTVTLCFGSNEMEKKVYFDNLFVLNLEHLNAGSGQPSVKRGMKVYTPEDARFQEMLSNLGGNIQNFHPLVRTLTGNA